PERDVARHVDLLRHPVVGASGQVFFPGPFVFERHQLIDVGGAVDDALVGGAHALGGAVVGGCARGGGRRHRGRGQGRRRRLGRAGRLRVGGGGFVPVQHDVIPLFRVYWQA